ncbi:MAG: pilus assembly protein [Alphaproteobacteria bacterium]|nr:pilus assembly protein [Alphaproteobacteria bacterium]
MSWTGFLKRKARNWRKDESGATAVEFAMIAVPFFYLVFSIIEVGSVLFTNTLMENAVLENSRQIRTGAAQESGLTLEQFRAAVCDDINLMADCDRLEIDVQVFDGFIGLDYSTPLTDDNDLDTSGFGFDAGDAGDIVLVRLFYKWPLILPTFSSGFANLKDNQRLLTAATVFRNEPFDD